MTEIESPVNQRIMKLIGELAGGTQRRFAEAIGIAPSIISDMFGKRQSRPSFDMLYKIGLAYPQVRMDWLVNGKEPMYHEIEREQKVDLSIFNDNPELKLKLLKDLEVTHVRTDLAQAAHSMATRENLARNIRNVRAIRKISLLSVAKALEISEVDLEQYEMAINDIPSDLVEKLAVLYDVPLDYLTSRADTEMALLRALEEYQRLSPKRLRADLDEILHRLNKAGI